MNPAAIHIEKNSQYMQSFAAIQVSMWLFCYLIVLNASLRAQESSHATRESSNQISSNSAADARPADEKTSLVEMPVSYDAAMLVVVGKAGVAAVRFNEVFEIGNETRNGVSGVQLQWRFIDRKNVATETAGNGRVFAKLDAGKVHHGSFDIHAGPFELKWQHLNRRSGTIVFDADSMSVYPVAAQYFNPQLFNALNGEQIIPAADMKTFLHDDLRWNPRDDENVVAQKPPLRTLPAPIPYGAVLLVQSPAGVAEFRFGKVFDRGQAPMPVFHGIDYRYRFKPRGEEAWQTGADEVYERSFKNEYTDSKLNLTAGPVQVKWSRGGNEMGWVYYDPLIMQIWYLTPSTAEIALHKLIEPPSNHSN